MKHTPEPWKHDPVWHLIYGPNKVEIAAIHAACDPREKRRVPLDIATANAERIIACVNACQGFTTERLQAIVNEGESLFIRFRRLEGK